MKRRDFLRTLGCGAVAGVLPSCATDSPPQQPVLENRPNILWLISEDTSPDLACYGNPLVKTPNLDKLAADGALFTNAFTTSPVCSAARSALMTGMYQTSIDAHHHRSHRSDNYTLPDPVEIITRYFQQAGYYTCNSDGLTYKKLGKTDWNFIPKSNAFNGTDWSGRRPDQPFFAQMNFSLTHRPFKRDKRNPIDPDTVGLPPYYPDHPLARRDWADYLESVQVLDTQIGIALTWLEKEGLADNTIVLYFSDHGRPHVRAKQWLYEGGIGIPMIIRWPGKIEPGTIVDDLVSTIDVAPTSLWAAGIDPPRHLQGHPFMGPDRRTRRYVFAARDRCGETVDRVRCVRSHQYKYIRNYDPDRPYTQFTGYKKLQYPVLTLMEVLHRQGKLTPEQARFMATARPAEELYDLREDPFELHNLADDPNCEKALKQHRRKLDEWVKTTEDQGETPEPDGVRDYWRGNAKGYFERGMKSRGLATDISDEDYLRWWEQKLLD